MSLNTSAASTMTYRVSLLLLLFGLYVPSAMHSQSPASGVTLFGKVQDAQTKAALPYLAIQLQTERDSAFVGGRLTSESGEFTFTALKKGVYVLVIRALGYRPIRQRVLIGELSAFLDLGVLPMTREPQALSEVVVTGSADGRSASMEKLTFTVADNISQSGGSVLQAMSTVPGCVLTPEPFNCHGSYPWVELPNPFRSFRQASKSRAKKETTEPPGKRSNSRCRLIG